MKLSQVKQPAQSQPNVKSVITGGRGGGTRPRDEVRCAGQGLGDYFKKKGKKDGRKEGKKEGRREN